MSMMKGQKPEVRILLLGEDGVGKTSLIMALVAEEFPEEVPARAEEITIPADITPEKVPTKIVDFSFAEQSEEDLAMEIRRADVICVVYAVDWPESLEKVPGWWLPRLRQVIGDDDPKPVILVGNKTDTDDEQDCMLAASKIMSEFKEVETCIECSSMTLRNVSEVFYYAQKSVLHPAAPLYDPDEKTLTNGCKKALTRIFKLCDGDGDDLLSDEELNAFQRFCFESPLTDSAVDELKLIISKNITDGLTRNFLTLKGFLFLHNLFIQRGRIETTWTALRKFGYDNDLRFWKDYLFPP